MHLSRDTAFVFRSGAYRPLAVCVGVSVAMHAAVLFALSRPGEEPQGRAPEALIASIMPAAAPGVSDGPAARTSPGATARRRQRREMRPEIPEEGTDRSVLGPALAPPPAQPADSSEPRPAPSASLAIRATPVAAVEASAPPIEARGQPVQASGSPSTGPADAEPLRGYREALMDAMRRYERYPPEARERGWEGRVEIRLVIGKDGKVKSATVKTPSRHRILDAQALDMVRRGSELAPVPAVLRGREFTLDIPVSFSLIG